MTGIAAARILLLTLLVAGGDARVVTVDAARNDLPIDVSQKAVPVRLEPGTYLLDIEGRLYLGAAADMRPVSEALVNLDPSATRVLDAAKHDVAAALALVWEPAGLNLRVLRPTTIYLFLADSELRGNHGQATVKVLRLKGEDYEPIASYGLDAVRNCYALDLPGKAVPVKLEPGTWVLTLKRGGLRYADHAAAPGEQPQHVVLDCNPARVAISWDEVGDSPTGTQVLCYPGESTGLVVTKPTTVRLYLTHSQARTYTGQVEVSVTRYQPRD